MRIITISRLATVMLTLLGSLSSGDFVLGAR